VPSTFLIRVRAFVRLGRPIFLIGGFALYGLGAAVAAFVGYSIDWNRYAWGQLAISATQLMTHYSNDYFDYEGDRVNTTFTDWSGGSRVLPNGELPRAIALAAAVFLAALALVANIVLQARFASPPLVTGMLLAALVLSWEYSAPPLRLHSRGVGELVAMFIVSMLVPLTGFVLQAGGIEPLALLSIAPLCFLQFAMLLAVEFPDQASDTLVGKRTLVVRLGPPRAAALYVGSLALAYLLLPAWGLLGLPGAVAGAVALLLPLAAWLVLRVLRGDHRKPRYFNRLAFGSAALVTISTLLEAGMYVQLATHSRADSERQNRIEEPRKAAQ
jgi:1,4-dihydroxy-2-naphthoate octaprenyltransferase